MQTPRRMTPADAAAEGIVRFYSQVERGEDATTPAAERVFCVRCGVRLNNDNHAQVALVPGEPPLSPVAVGLCTACRDRDPVAGLLAEPNSTEPNSTPAPNRPRRRKKEG